MKTRLKQASIRIRKLLYFFPFTLHFLVFAFFGILGWTWLKHQIQPAGTAFHDIYQLLLKVVIVFTVLVLSFSLVTVVISWLYFFLKKKENNIRLNISTPQASTPQEHAQQIQISINPVIQPVMGDVRIRLIYDNENYTGRFSLAEKKSFSFFSKSIKGIYNWKLPEIKEYHVSKAIVYFEDFFGFFSLPVVVETHNRFSREPQARDIKVEAYPRTTEETVTRIEEIRRVEGEHINYKQFETNDDVRRIVWKIYAKNKDLVVRIPEIMDPFASHIYLYASYFNAFDNVNNRILKLPFLNHFKTVTWSVYRQLVKQQLDVRYVSDQGKQFQNYLNQPKDVKAYISRSAWQDELPLENYCNRHHTAVLVVSSLCDAQQVKQLAASHGNDLIIIFVKLTKAFSNNKMTDLFQWIFIQQEKIEMERMKQLWRISPLRNKILKNEMEIENYLAKFEKPVVI